MLHFLSKTSLPRAAAAALPPLLPAFFVAGFAGGSCANTAPATASAAVPTSKKLRFTVPPAFARVRAVAGMIPPYFPRLAAGFPLLGLFRREFEACACA